MGKRQGEQGEKEEKPLVRRMRVSEHKFGDLPSPCRSW